MDAAGGYWADDITRGITSYISSFTVFHGCQARNGNDLNAPSPVWYMIRLSPSLINSLPVRCCRVLLTIRTGCFFFIWRADYRVVREKGIDHRIVYHGMFYYGWQLSIIWLF
ncbi:hypothetical protein KCP76_19290 [Salmonella enterica subsp. enterica serovar Weltevreden]|nr:hypothetical protein KCP76_19290 [Salmonella enterica subsp. enterica serovar Weltevreden]